MEKRLEGKMKVRLSQDIYVLVGKTLKHQLAEGERE
jgi:hypothetical protein